ncbi:MAG TPA: hypothetical protein VM581_05010, partial [Magnetospirillaceae bacterium]|nr:hypothetical protein [Magnetospirillaceae bacterium]
NDDLAKTLNEGLQFEETPMPGAAPSTPPLTASLTPPADDDDKMPTLDPEGGNDDTSSFGAPTMTSTPSNDAPKDDKPAPKVEHHNGGKKPDHVTKGNSDLDGIKASALEALRPLVGKLKLPAEERFDTLLLIIRSTDDQNLLSQAHDAAKEITDDTRRAQALLDVIKEIDYFSSKR